MKSKRSEFIYGVLEKQFSKVLCYGHKDERCITGEMSASDPWSQDLTMLFTDMGLANTRREARQIVNHGHVTVNGQES